MDSDRTDAVNGRTPDQGMSLDDIYYTVFRHKWLLLGFTCMGVIAAMIIPSVKPPRYESQAKVMLKYVLDTPAVSPANAESIKSLDSGGQAIMNSEVMILTSADVAEAAVDLVGPEKILAKLGGGSNRLAATAVIQSGLSVDAPQRTTVITLTFKHRDPDVVQDVLEAVLKSYNQKHREVHTGYGVLDEYYHSRRDELRDKVAQTEEQLKILKTQAKVLSSVKDAKQSYQTDIEKLKAELRAAETELAVAKAVVGDVAQGFSTNEARNAPAPAETIKEYTEIVEQLETLKRNERELIAQSHFTSQHPQVLAIRNVTERYKNQKAAFEKEFPSLIALSSIVGARGSNSLGVDIAAEAANIKRLSAKVQTLGTMLTNIQADAIGMMDLEPQIAQLERQREQDEKDYLHFQATIDQARQSESAGAGKVVNMSIVQHPTPPGVDNKKLLKLVGIAFCGFVGLGVALAFLIDLILDRTIRRSRDVRRYLHLPLLLSIPEPANPQRSVVPRWLRGMSKDPTGAKTSGEATQANGVAPWDDEHQLRAFADGLRERLITYFEINNITHAPKLVGVTGCNKGSGVTTLASGLASALSKIGNGNVLFVDMNVGQGEAHSFHSGKPGCALANVMDPGQTNGGVQENLYLASSRAGVNDKLAKVMPEGFTNLVTSLKASDYDYIIFDMPSVTPTSATPRLGGYMDMVLFVVESGKTSQQLASQAGALLTEARANAAVVLNKCRQYVPPALSHDM